MVVLYACACSARRRRLGARAQKFRAGLLPTGSVMPGRRWSVFALLAVCCAGTASGQCVWDLQADGVAVDGVVAPHTEVSGVGNDQVNYCLQVQAGVTYDFVVALGGPSCQDCLWDSCLVVVCAVETLLSVCTQSLFAHPEPARSCAGCSHPSPASCSPAPHAMPLFLCVCWCAVS